MPGSITSTRPRRWILVVLGISIIAVATYWTVVSFRSAGVVDVASDDLAHAWQTVWNVGHGSGFQHSHIPIHHNASRLATHADYMLALLAPLSWLWPNYQVLLLFQAVVVAIGAWFVFRIAWLRLQDDAVAFICALSYLLAGMVAYPVIWQFHAVTLAMTLLLAMVEAILSRRRGWLVWLWFVLALTTKEQVGFIAGPFALIVTWGMGRKKLGWWLLGSGIVYSLAQYLIILPHFAPVEVDHVFWQFYFGSLGHTPAEIIPKLVQPAELWHRLTRTEVLQSSVAVLLPVAFLCLLHPLALLAVVAVLPHWLSDPASVVGIFAQNHVLAVPIVFVSAIFSLKKIQQRVLWPKFRKPLMLGLGLFAFLGTCLLSPYPWSSLFAPVDLARDPDLHTLQLLNRNIPTTAVVGYSWGIPPIFANRQTTHVLPYGLGDIDYAVVHPSKSVNFQNLVGPYDDQLFTYFDHSAAFVSIFRSPTIGIYRRIATITPEKLPDSFVDKTPTWTGHCGDTCLQRVVGE